MPNYRTFRITRPLPVVVDGGLTQWRITYDVHGKGGNRACFEMTCLNAKEEIKLPFTESRASVIEARIFRSGLSVPTDSKAEKIFLKLVKIGWAEEVIEEVDLFGDETTVGLRPTVWRKSWKPRG